MKMLIITRTLAMVLVITFSATMTMAQETTLESAWEYGYDHTLEMSFGRGSNLKGYSQLPDEGVALCGHDCWGIGFDLRYSRFVSRHWGWFGQINWLSLSNDNLQLEAPLSRHYNPDGREVRVDAGNDCGFNDCGSFYDNYLVGAVYRYDIGRWSFRPRLGIGLIRQFSESAEYYLIEPRHSDRDYQTVELTTANHDGKAYDHFNAFAYSPSIQVNFAAGRHFFFSAEAQWLGTIGHLYQRSVTKQYIADEPQDWQPEKDGYFWIKGDSRYIKTTDDHLTRFQMGNFLQFRLGLGWYIGRNRNGR